jgi:hypothetical protein
MAHIKIRILFLLTVLISCSQINKKDKLNNKSEFRKLNHFDTLTSKGWQINYFTKTDSTDLFLTWSKNNMAGEYIDSSALKLRSDFIPYLSGESNYNIFMNHLCASDCEAVLILSKAKFIGKDFSHVIRYDTITDKIVTVEDLSYTNEDTFKVALTNLKTFKDTIISFQNLALGSFKTGYIDSIRFDKDETYISGLLIARSDDTRQKYIRETKIIKF